LSAPLARTKPWAALTVLCIANFLILLDTTIVNTALPDIQSSLSAGIDEALWVLNGYLLAFASLLIVFGRLGDVVGPRTVFVAGLGVFTVASALCALATSAGALVAARVLQGLGAAALLPQALVLISAIFPAHRRGAAFGVFTAVAGIASVSGPTLGGLLITEFGWQSIFYLNLPVGLLGIVLAVRLVPDLRVNPRERPGHPRPAAPRRVARTPRRWHRFDLPGVLLATLGLVGVTYGLVEGERQHWGQVAGPVSIPAVLAAGAVLLVAFVLWERRAPEPLIPLGLFRDRNFSLATLITLATSFALFGLLLVFVLETQTMLGMSPLMFGVTGLPWTLTLSAVAPVAGRLADRVGGRVLLVAGLACYAAGVLGVALVGSSTSTAATFVLPLVVVGVGTGMTFAPATTEALRGIAPQQVGAASGVLNTARQVGAALGAAVVGALLQHRLASGASFLSASRLSLAVVAAVVLAGSGLAVFMRRPAPAAVPVPAAPAALHDSVLT
jgi:MFS family permease